MSPRRRSIIVWLGVLLLLGFVWHSMTREQVKSGELNYTQLLDAIEAGEIASMEASGGELSGKFTDIGAQAHDSEEFTSFAVINDPFIEKLEKHKIKVTFKPEDDGSWLGAVLIYTLPMLILFILIMYTFRRMNAGGRKADEFGKSRAKLLQQSQDRVTFDDVAGIDESKDELQEVVEFLRDSDKFTKLGARIPKGILLVGAPGTGKTLLAKSVAGEADVPFFSISGSDFVEMFVGVGASRVRDLFEQGKRNAPCIIFIDEIDAVGRYRGTGLGGGNDEREQTLNQLLVEMDGFVGNNGVILIAATNRPDVLDPALLRPGRFDRRVVIPSPDVCGREAILKIHTKKTPLSDEVNLNTIAKMTPGLTGAELSNLVNEAALIAAQRDADCVAMRDFNEAKDRLLLGRERRSLLIPEKERAVTAHHEAGHALIAKLLGEEDVDVVHKVTIIPRGHALGAVIQMPERDQLSYSKQWVLNRIAISMGGRIAEELIYDKLTTGAGNDIEQATKLARRLVTEWGMSDKLGPVAYNDAKEHPFLGREFSSSKQYSEHTAQLIDQEVKHFILTQYELSRNLLVTNLAKLKEIAQALLEFETIDGHELDLVINKGLSALQLERKKLAPKTSQDEEQDWVDIMVETPQQSSPKSIDKADDSGIESLTQGAMA